MNKDSQLLWRSVYDHRLIVAASVVLALGAALLEVFSIGMLIPFLQTFSENGQDVFKTGIVWVDTHVLAVDLSQVERTYRICLIILIATWLRSGTGYLAGVYAVVSRVRIVEDLRRKIVDQLQSVSLRYFTKTRSGDLINSITSEIGRTSAGVSVIFNVITQATMMLMYVALMVWISPGLTALVLGVFLALAYGLTWLMRTIRTRGKRLTEASSAFTSRFSEFIDGIRTITAYNRQPYERERMETTISNFADATIATYKRSSLVQPVSHAIVGTVVVVLIVVAVQFYVIPGILDIAFLLGFLFALFRLMPVVHNLNAQRGVWASNRAGLAKVANLIDREGKPYQKSGSRSAPVPQRSIVFENVDFAYEPDQLVLRDINLEIKAGSMVALVGGSGAGKSTLADLLPRFHDPIDGRILLDDTDLRTFDLNSLRDRIGVVSQHTHIFNDTVWANIGYGNLAADRDAIRCAAEQANALAFIEEMEDGFDTVLGDRGVRLSGGQRQRLAIARALLKDPDILILDEATSNLDSVSEQLVQNSIEHLMEGRTVLAIAHRLSTIENADWVVVLEEGRVAEQGRYDDLVEQRSHLWKYHRVQFQHAVAPAP